MAKKVVQILEKKPLEELEGVQSKQKLRVCAYCRVSTDSEEQKESYANQLDHYTNLIQNNPNWEFVDIYADEGISGTSDKKRIQFKQMIEDAKAGKIDMILTKSISRFSRNTVVLLENARELKNLGIAIVFEKENINTLEASGEVLLTILSSIAQDESRNISENSRWGIVKGFRDGKVYCNTTRFLGYDKDKNGELVINEKEAEIVKRIYREYLEGKSTQAIAKGLMADGIKTAADNDKWWDSTVTGILTNEKYYGALLQQKTITVDYLTKKRVKNDGQATQYFIEENHEPIIPKEVFEQVQKEKKRRAELKGYKEENAHRYSSKYPFSGKLVCMCCGNTLKRRIWNSNNISRKVVWQCKTYIAAGKQGCDAKAVDDTVLMEAFVRAFNRMKEDKDQFVQTMNRNIEKVLLKNADKTKIQKIDKKIEELKQEYKGLVQLNLKGEMDAEIYQEEQVRIGDQLEQLREQKHEIEISQESKEQYKKRVQEIMNVFKQKEGLLEQFDDGIFNALVEKVEILSPTHFVFVLKNGMRVEEEETNL
ncbi:recombinase family protein [Fredinandcohnia humi]